jgi:hypothetical protein
MQLEGQNLGVRNISGKTLPFEIENPPKTKYSSFLSNETGGPDFPSLVTTAACPCNRAAFLCKTLHKMK